MSDEDRTCVLPECSLLATPWTTLPPLVIMPEPVTEARTERADMSQELVVVAMEEEEEEGVEERNDISIRAQSRGKITASTLMC